MIQRVSPESKRRWTLVFLLPVLLAARPLAARPLAAQAPAAQQAQMLKMQRLACYYSADRSELALALMSVSQETDPTRNYGFREELEVKLETSQEMSTIVGNGDLKVAVLGDLVREVDRQYTLFRFNIVIDESCSIDDASLQAARRIIERFLSRIPVCYQAQVIRFSNVPQVVTGFINDPDALISAIKSQRIAGGTAFYDAIDQALTELKQSEGDVPLRFTIAFTDGEDTSSKRFASFDDFRRKINMVTEREQIPLFLAGIGAVNHSLLSQTAGDMGLYMPLAKLPDIDKLFDTVANALEKTYIIRIPISSAHQGLKTAYILKRRPNGRHETIQDVPIPDGCTP